MRSKVAQRILIETPEDVRSFVRQCSDSIVTAPTNFLSATGKGVVSSKIRNYASDPFFLRKAAEAKAEIDRVGLPGKEK